MKTFKEIAQWMKVEKLGFTSMGRNERKLHSG
jgi:hypothetical protein